jgi:hypothetical protein
MQSQRESAAGAIHNVVLFRQSDCDLNFATATTRQLTGILNLELVDSVKIVRQTDTFLRLQCSTWHVKRHIMSWDTRNAAATQFHINIKEDLLKYERIQKAQMWSTMVVMFTANMKPSWSRSAITWKHNNVRFFIHPGELPHDLPAGQILDIVQRRCGIRVPAAPTSSKLASTSVETNPERPEPAVNQSISPQPTNYSKHAANHLIALQQDLAAVKRRAAEKFLDICMLRKKLQKKTALLEKTQEQLLAATSSRKKEQNESCSEHVLEVQRTQDAAAQTESTVVADVDDLHQQLIQARQSCESFLAHMRGSIEEQVIAMVSEKTAPIMKRIDTLQSENTELLAQIAVLKKMAK